MTETKCSGEFLFEAYDRHGNLKWSERFANGATTAGLNDLLTVGFNSGTQKTSWFMGLISNASFSALAAGDTLASHAGWLELTDYTSATRPQWTPGTAASGSIVNTTTVDFTINATVSINGAFLASNSTKGGTTGILYATGSFLNPQSLVNTDVLKVTYTITLTPA